MKKNKMKKFGVRILTIAIVALAVTLGTVGKPAYAAGHYPESVYITAAGSTSGTSVWVTYSTGVTIGDPIDSSMYVGYGYANNRSAVERLQMLLNHYGAGLVTDGLFGDKTHNAIRNYQSNHGDCYGVDGVAGLNTWVSLARNF
jgi:peptidoglycan hydrolase-like protein with peptidoglycan-binding domain